MDKKALLGKLKDNHPGWTEWDALIALVHTLDLEIEHEEYLGEFLACGVRLCFKDGAEIDWPQWMPSYVQALYGMKADEPMMAGGYASNFRNSPTIRGEVFADGSDDEDMGFPVFDVPAGIYGFQSNSSGALFHIDEALNILAPDSERECMRVIDTLENFTRSCIRQTLADEEWFVLYKNLPGTFMD